MPTRQKTEITEMKDLTKGDTFKFNPVESFTFTVHSCKLTRFNEIYLHAYQTKYGNPNEAALGIYKPTAKVIKVINEEF